MSIRAASDIMLDALRQLQGPKTLAQEASAWVILACSSTTPQTALYATQNALASGVSLESLAEYALGVDSALTLQAALTEGLNPRQCVDPGFTGHNPELFRPLIEVAIAQEARSCLPLLNTALGGLTTVSVASPADGPQSLLGLAARKLKPLSFDYLIEHFQWSQNDLNDAFLVLSSRSDSYHHSGENLDVPHALQRLLERGAQPHALYELLTPVLPVPAKLQGVSSFTAAHLLADIALRKLSEGRPASETLQILQTLPDWLEHSNPAVVSVLELIIQHEVWDKKATPTQTHWLEQLLMAHPQSLHDESLWQMVCERTGHHLRMDLLNLFEHAALSQNIALSEQGYRLATTGILTRALQSPSALVIQRGRECLHCFSQKEALQPMQPLFLDAIQWLDQLKNTFRIPHFDAHQHRAQGEQLLIDVATPVAVPSFLSKKSL